MAAVVSLVGVLGLAAVAEATHLFSDVAGHTTLERVIAGADPANGYATLDSQPVNGSYVVRDGAGESDPLIPDAQAGRENRRRSLSYFGQLTDFQLADEESPARVEFLDQDPSGFAASAWRPQEALQPFIIDWSIRQMNLFAGASPVQQGDGSRAAMDFALATGDQADNMQRNEILWTRALLEGGPVDPNSGSTNPTDWNPAVHPSCAAFPPNVANLAEAARYTGVQDYDDYDEGANPYFYDPDSPQAAWSDWPAYAGLMDRAQLPFTAAGLDVPSYVTNGNHDALAQGNEDGNAAFEDIAMGCFKALGTTSTPTGLDPSVLLTPSSAHMLVPPDPLRRFINKRQIKAEYAANAESNAHGYEFVDEDENINSSFSASYYAWDPPEAPGFRFISIDTLSEGGIVEQSANGNVDDPQFQWLQRELQFSSASDKLIVVFGHHPIRSLSSNAPDEAAGPCTGTDHAHGDVPEHDQSPGCDIDPRSSTPLHFGEPSQRPPGSTDETISQLFTRFPHVIAYVGGHTHENRIEPFTRSGGGVWWGIETSATADWPVQHRAIEVMDNLDGTLSIFGTVLDAASDAQSPAPGSAQAFNEEMLASIGRELAYNDPQAGLGSGEGTAADQNVELLVKDPRTANLELVKSDSPDPVPLGEDLTYTLSIANHGPSAASPVTVTDTLPASVEFVSATATQGSCLHLAGSVTCDLGDMAQQTSATVTIEVVPTATGTIVNQAGVDSPQADDNPADNSDTEETVVSPGQGYPRPKSASPLRVSLVAAYDECAVPDRVHGPPLAFPSCSSPQQSSQHLTVGTPDANGNPANSVGFLRLSVQAGDPSTTASEADVKAQLDITDVRRQSDLADYTGEVQAEFIVRITDRFNAVAPGGGTHAATMLDIPFPVTGSCAITASPSIGGRCGVTTSFNSIVPGGAIMEGKRAIMALDQVRVFDGGSDGQVGTLPNTLFAAQGLFVP
ncbi:MAG: hypothetical protein ACRDLQ_02740 [Solirubrobacterales bacterium]